MSRKVISKGEELRKGDCLVSNNGNWKMVFQVSQAAVKTVNVESADQKS